MMIGLHFAPDGLRARRLDAHMHDDLAVQLSRLDGDSRPPLSAGAFRTLLEGLRTGARFGPDVFALHDQFREDCAKQRTDLALERLTQLSRARPWRGKIAITEALSDGREAKASVERALTFIDQSLPELGGEVSGLVREIRVVTDASGACPWGAIFVEASASPLSMVEQLARATAQQLLAGGLAAAGDDSAGLRAAFASARVHWAMTRLGDSGLLAPSERAKAYATASAHRSAFDSAAASAVVAGRGLTLLRAAKAYLDRPAEVRWAA